MTTREYIRMIAYKEGAEACRDKVLPTHNPYEGVSYHLSDEWCRGWWDMFDSE